MVQSPWKIVWQLLRKLNTDLLYDPAIPREPELYVHTNPCIRIFITVLFTTGKKWGQFNCLLADEWIEKM